MNLIFYKRSHSGTTIKYFSDDTGTIELSKILRSYSVTSTTITIIVNTAYNMKFRAPAARIKSRPSGNKRNTRHATNYAEVYETIVVPYIQTRKYGLEMRWNAKIT